MASPISPQADPSILDTFKTKLKNEWTYHACHRHNANSKEGCLRADSESGEWVTHCCTKDFYNTSEIVTWMLLTDGQTGQTNLSALLSAAQDQDSGHDMRNQPGRLKAIDLGKAGRESYIVFAILLNLDCGSLIHTFQRYGITDSNLSNERLSNLEALEEQLQTSVLDVNKLLTSFDNMRFMFQHVIMELNTAAVYSDRVRGRWISPFCRRQLINNKGGTAQVWQVSVQDRFLSQGLKERLKRSEYIDPVYGKVTFITTTRGCVGSYPAQADMCTVLLDGFEDIHKREQTCLQSREAKLLSSRWSGRYGSVLRRIRSR